MRDDSDHRRSRDEFGSSVQEIREPADERFEGDEHGRRPVADGFQVHA